MNGQYTKVENLRIRILRTNTLKILTSSNFLQIIVKALKMESVDPVTVTILSGHDESEMLILAPLCKISNVCINMRLCRNHSEFKQKSLVATKLHV